MKGGVGLRVAVVDGQGGGIGRLIVEKMRQELGQGVHILALGTQCGSQFSDA